MFDFYYGSDVEVKYSLLVFLALKKKKQFSAGKQKILSPRRLFNSQ